jgi:hypothetical protein
MERYTSFGKEMFQGQQSLLLFVGNLIDQSWYLFAFLGALLDLENL